MWGRVFDYYIFDLAGLFFLKLLELDTACFYSELRDEFAGFGFGTKDLDVNSFGQEVVLSAVDIDLFRKSMITFVLVEAHASQSTHTDVGNSTHYVCVVDYATIL